MLGLVMVTKLDLALEGGKLDSLFIGAWTIAIYNGFSRLKEGMGGNIKKDMTK